MQDIVFPKHNEKEFIEIAEKLSYDELCFLYPIEEFLPKPKQSFETNIKVSYGIFCSSSQIQKAKQLAKFVVVKADENQRRIIESSPSIIIDLESISARDSFHYRNSGLNQVLCGLAAKNNVSIGFNFNSVLNASQHDRNIILGRMKQNINLCQKYKVRMGFGSFARTPYEMRNYNDIIGLFRTIGLR
ncbi:hypothetical protein HY636_04320 [Candidatus Woesearchaeota archaeon]|nr:hypothetical protein [Candidatus Woesearchaeota archaeon]